MTEIFYVDHTRITRAKEEKVLSEYRMTRIELQNYLGALLWQSDSAVRTEDDAQFHSRDLDSQGRLSLRSDVIVWHT